jgi:predicted metal-dependent peptidase
MPILRNFGLGFYLNSKYSILFFATVAMFASFRIDELVDFAKTLDKTLVVNPEFLSSLSEDERFSYLLHQILHLALGHLTRGQGYEQVLWNIAADISVNNIIIESTQWRAAPHTAWDSRFSGDSVERIYAILRKQVTSEEQAAQDSDSKQSSSSSSDSNGSPSSESISEGSNSGDRGSEQSKQNGSTANDGSNQSNANGSASSDSSSKESNSSNSGSNSAAKATQKKTSYVALAKKYQCKADFNAKESPTSQEYWRTSMIKANQLNPCSEMGKGSSSLAREIDLATNGQIDWRVLLWKYATPDLVDYHEFDHRFIHAGYYTETLLSESIVVDVVVDTSGSISKGELTQFLSEMLAIYACHTDVKLQFYYADDKLYGPYDIPDNINNLPVPVGAGGTSFKPYFNELANNKSLLEYPQAIIYFTDGYGDFPKQAPSTPVLWLLTEDGLLDENIPFGTAVRIKD